MTNYWGTAILIGNITYKELDVCLLPGRFVVQVLLASKRLRPASWKATKRCPAEATKDPKSQNLCSMVTMVYCIWLVVWNILNFFHSVGNFTDPNWLSLPPSCFRGVGIPQPPSSVSWIIFICHSPQTTNQIYWMIFIYQFVSHIITHDGSMVLVF